MAEVDYLQLQQLYGGCYIARHHGSVIASAESYDELSDQLDRTATERTELVIEYVEPPNLIVVY
jgi:hypothetical protein